MKNKYLIILILLILIKLLNCTELYFQASVGFWDNELNWDPNAIPTINDEAYINKTNGQQCIAYKDIEAFGVQVGGDSVYALLYSNASSTINYLISLNKDTEVIFNNGSVVSLSFILANQSTVSVMSNDFSNSFLILNGNSTFNLLNSGFVLSDIQQRNSLMSIKKSNGVITNGTSGLKISDDSTLSFESTNVTVYSDLNILSSNFIVSDYSNVFIKCYNEKLIHWDPFTIPDNDTIQNIGYFSSLSSHFFIEKVYLSLYSWNVLKYSIATFNNTFTSYSSYVLSNGCILTFNAPVFLLDNTILLASYGSEIYFNSLVLQFENSSLSFYETQVVIESPGFVYQLRNHSTFMIYDNSTLTIKSNFTNFDNVQVAVNNSEISVLGYLNCYDYSAFAVIDSTLYIQKDFLLHDSSLLAYLNSYVSVSGSQVFNNYSGFAFDYSTINIDGSFIYSSDISVRGSGFSNSNVNVNGFFHNYGYLIIIESNVNSYNELLLKGTMVISNSIFIIQNGNFYIYGELYSLNSKFILEDGFIILYPNSYFNVKDSTFTLFNGQLLISNDSTFRFRNSTLYNSNKAIVSASGDIILDSNGFIKNSAEMYLYSSILQSNSTNGSENIINNGKLIILNSNNSSSKVTNVMVPLINNGGKIIINSKYLNSFQFNQSNGGDLNINNSTLNSNNTITIDNSFISGTGSINSTSIEFNNSTIGNNENNDKIITILNIIGEFKSSRDQINFIIQSEFNSSFINIENLATINNSTLIIKINQDIEISGDKNITLMNFRQLNGTGFSDIKFKYFNPITGEEKETGSCKFKTNLDSKSITLLIGQNECSKNKLSTGAIIGIIMGSLGFVVIVSIILKIKSNWFYLKYYTVKEASIKLKTKFNFTNK